MDKMSWKNCLTLLWGNCHCFFSLFLIIAIFVYKMNGIDGFFVHRILFLFFLLLLAIIDWKKGILPDCILLPMGIVGMLLQLWFDSAGIVFYLISAMLAASFFCLLYWISDKGMGAGDIKFAFVLGLWMSGPCLVLALLLSFWFGGIAAVILLLSHRKGLRDKLPFGPFMAVGSYISFLFANELFIVWMELDL